jgi:ABC-2 type transport system ATP-binding protein
MTLLARDLWQSYGSTPALVGVDLALAGGVVALLGPNGSGKTTLLRCLASSLRPDRGEIWWRGRPIWPRPRFLRRQLGYLPQALDFPRRLTPLRLMEHLARLKGRHGGGQIRRLLAELGIEASADRPFAALSAGQVRLVGVAQALLGRPALLLLDEPTRGLDVEERERVFRALRRLASQALILFSSHAIDDAARVAGRVVTLKEGRVCYFGEAEVLRRSARGLIHEVRAFRQSEGALPASCRISKRVEEGNQALLRVVGRLPAGFPAVAVEPTLEEAYLALLNGEDKKQPPL